MTLPHPSLLLLCGLPFAGKTTLTRAIVRHLRIPHASLDEVNGERGVGRDGQAIPQHEWDATYAEAYRRVEARLSRGESIVYDETNFLRRQRDQLRAIAARHGATTLVIYVDVTTDEARRRWLANRTTRQRGDVRDDDFALVLANFEPPTADENVLRYDGATPPDAWIERTFGSIS